LSNGTVSVAEQSRATSNPAISQGTSLPEGLGTWLNQLWVNLSYGMWRRWQGIVLAGLGKEVTVQDNISRLVHEVAGYADFGNHSLI
jgi:hypothetical protein